MSTIKLGNRLIGTVYYHRGYKLRIAGYERWTCAISLEKDEEEPLEGEEREAWVTGLSASTRKMHLSLTDYGCKPPAVSLLAGYKEPIELLLSLLAMESYQEVLEQNLYDRSLLMRLKQMLTTCMKRNTSSWIWLSNMFGFVDIQDANKLHLWLSEYLVAFDEYLAGGISEVIFSSRYGALLDRAKKQQFIAQLQQALDVVSETLEEESMGDNPLYTELNIYKQKLEQDIISRGTNLSEQQAAVDGLPTPIKIPLELRRQTEKQPSDTSVKKQEWNDLIDLSEVFSYYLRIRTER